MKLKSRIAIGVVVALVLVAGVGAWLAFQAGRSGSGLIEKWVGAQVQSVAGAYLNPRLSFDDPDYQYPRTIILSDLKLTADDPANPGKSIDVLSVRKMHLELAEIPSQGQPLRIEKLILEKPEIRAVSAGEGRGFVGFTNLVKSPGERRPDDAAKLSDAFQLRLVEVRDGSLLYDPREPGGDAMRLDGIHTQMGVEPAGEGWYKLKTSIERKPLLTASVDGRINIDTMTLDLADLTAAMALDGKAEALPPALQRLVKEHDVRGDLTVKAKGQVPVSDWQNSALDARLELKNGNVAAGEYRLPIELMTGEARVSGGSVTLEPVEARTLGGRLNLTGRVGLGEGMPADLRLTATKLRIEETLRVFSEGGKGEPKYRGLADARVDFKAPLGAWNTRAAGGGELHITKGSLANLPVLEAIMKVMKNIPAVGGKGGASSDELHGEFDFRGDRARFTDINGRTAVVALRGAGDVFFDQRLDLKINAGPVEKLQSLMGDAGKIIGAVTDGLTAYRVTGTLGDPKVAVTVGSEPTKILDQLIK